MFFMEEEHRPDSEHLLTYEQTHILKPINMIPGTETLVFPRSSSSMCLASCATLTERIMQTLKQ